MVFRVSGRGRVGADGLVSTHTFQSNFVFAGPESSVLSSHNLHSRTPQCSKMILKDK